MRRGWPLIEADFTREYPQLRLADLTVREFRVHLSGLSGDSLYREWSRKQPREAGGEQETRAALARL